MPYYSYGYGYDSANLVYLILLVPVLLLSLYAQAAVSGNFSRYSKVMNRRGLTGAQAAAGVLRAHGITDVGIARCSGKLTDHYDPRNNTIFLSDSVYDAATVAAVGVAAHEAGHAVQYAVGYGPVKLRSTIVKTTQFSSQASFIILMLGLVLYSQPILLLGIVLSAWSRSSSSSRCRWSSTPPTARSKRWRVSISWRTRRWPVRERCSAPRR